MVVQSSNQSEEFRIRMPAQMEIFQFYFSRGRAVVRKYFKPAESPNNENALFGGAKARSNCCIPRGEFHELVSSRHEFVLHRYTPFFFFLLRLFCCVRHRWISSPIPVEDITPAPPQDPAVLRASIGSIGGAKVRSQPTQR